jgi:hypothetical protein
LGDGGDVLVFLDDEVCGLGCTQYCTHIIGSTLITRLHGERYITAGFQPFLTALEEAFFAFPGECLMFFQLEDAGFDLIDLLAAIEFIVVGVGRAVGSFRL